MSGSGDWRNAASEAQKDARAVTGYSPAETAAWCAGRDAAVLWLREKARWYDARATTTIDEYFYARRECALACDYAANAIDGMEAPK